MKSIFPDPNLASEDGLLTVGGFISPEILLDAYSHGIFPWPISVDLPLAWFSPDPRGVIFLENFSISKNLKKTLKQTNFYCRFNTQFEKVIKGCARHHSQNFSKETWITPEMIKGYCELHQKGHAYSIETYNKHNELVGGVYGVNIGGFFSGESMFYTEDNASKFALFTLLEFLQSKKITMLDTQMTTPITEKFGATYIARAEYLEHLNKSLQQKSFPWAH